MQYESFISSDKKVMAKVKVFVHAFNADTDADTRAMALAPKIFVPKARVSYCHSALSIVRPSVHRRPSINFSHLQLLLQNCWMDFVETW